jgi:FkbM family methyltransferase
MSGLQTGWLSRLARRGDARETEPAPPPEPWSGDFPAAATEADILACFRLLLGRLPNREEWSGHSRQAGQPLPAVVSAYLNSLEFSRRGLLRQDHMAEIATADLPGFRIHAAAADAAVGRHVLANAYEPDVSAVFRAILQPGMGVLDLGANIGYFAMLAGSLVGPSGYVLAVEPNPANVRLMEASRRANGFDQVTICQSAAGPQTGLLVLNASHSNGTTAGLPDDMNAMLGAEIVPCLRPDALVPPGKRIDLIKIDVEGAEYKALSGCTGIIARDRPAIVSEFSPDLMPGISGVDGPFYLRWLTGLGYRLSVIEPDGSLLAAPDQEFVMDLYRRRGTDHVDIVARPG